MPKQIIYADAARRKLKAGVDALAAAVVTTLGPKGRNVALAKSWGAPQVVNDGVTVAKEIELADPFENMGAQLVREAASKTNDNAGDGTTTATLLTQSIVSEGLKNIAAGANPMVLRHGLEKAMKAVIEALTTLSKPVSSPEEKEQVATISADSQEIGVLIAQALDKVGNSGVITVEESKGLQLEVSYKEGMQLDKGYVSPYFVTDSERMEAIIENPYILVTDKKISSLQDMLPFLEKLVKVSKNLVIIADDVDGEALATLVVNKLRGTFNVLAIKAPGFGDRRKAMLEDIAILTGAKLISEDTGRSLESVEVADLGQADRVISDKDETVVVGGKGSQEAITSRVAQLKRQIEKTDSDYDREKLEERLARLTGGVAVINVGAATETELKEKKLRVEDAVNATKAAIEEGIVPGGGVALLKARKALSDLSLEGDEKVGRDILYEALSSPVRKIVENAGVDSGWVVRELEQKEDNIGFDVVSMGFSDMIASGIIDPTKVTKQAVINAVSVATMILTTESLVADIPEEKKDNLPGAGMGGMGGMEM